ncbi:uncharacterized protein LOC121732408 [Aricia agestis]|uniref:uncharacterized protein LOC121732408 n=1 Tax=Aricia agestis TaxID=91739 RepID=UPI001C208DC7|nr:uncharacterized protein LOC121732408 [Aricia agestis]
MSADWRNEQAILRDLAIAQGMVPVESVETVECNEKPPSLHIEEETEEHFIGQYVADGSSAVAPDFGQIQDMLDLVRDVSLNDIENYDDNADKSKKVSEATENKSPRKPEKVDVKRNKNVAMESILKQQEVHVRKKIQPVLIQPESMFKPKSKTSVASTSKESVGNNVSNKSGGNARKPESVSKASEPGVFVPSSQAQEYYKKLMEAKRQQELREETIWTRAERQMREIEERRRSKVAN